MSLPVDLPWMYLLGKWWPVPPKPHKSPQIPPKPRLSHPGLLGLSCCHATLGSKGDSSWQSLSQPACLPGACIPVSSKQGFCRR